MSQIPTYFRSNERMKFVYVQSPKIMVILVATKSHFYISYLFQTKTTKFNRLNKRECMASIFDHMLFITESFRTTEVFHFIHKKGPHTFPMLSKVAE